jgi:hypothetical protein
LVYFCMGRKRKQRWEWDEVLLNECIAFEGLVGIIGREKEGKIKNTHQRTKSNDHTKSTIWPMIFRHAKIFLPLTFLSSYFVLSLFSFLCWD